MHDELNNPVERLTSEVAALKLELATLTSALRELQSQQANRRVPMAKPVSIPPPLKPSMAPAAIVVLLATGLLTWQLIVTPPSGSASHLETVAAAAPISAETVMRNQRVSLATPTEPPITPLIRPTIYKGTLAVNADHPGATVFVNRQNVGQAPVRVPNLRAGSHLVWVEHEGYRRWTRVITVPAERVTRVSVDLEPMDTQ